MKVGVGIFATDYTIDLGDLAVMAEESGFESLLVPEHTHIPLSRKSPWPGGAPLPDEYYHCLLYTSPSPRDKRQSRMPSSA